MLSNGAGGGGPSLCGAGTQEGECGHYFGTGQQTSMTRKEKVEQTCVKIIGKTKKYLKTSDIVLDYGCGLVTPGFLNLL